MCFLTRSLPRFNHFDAYKRRLNEMLMPTIQLVFPNALCYPLNAFNTFTLSFHFKWKLFNENRLNQNGYGGIGENTKSHGHEKCRHVM